MEFTHVANPVRVRANAIKRVEKHMAAPVGCLVAILDGAEDVLLTPEMLARITPVSGDYLVTQEDGYVYINPKDVFERKYSPL
jgi:hypothetical protein